MDWALAGSAFTLTLFDVTEGEVQAENVGRVRPVALVAGASRPASPWAPIWVRSMAALMACRTASWLVGHLFRFGMKALVLPGASQ